ncbi:MAG: LysM peptidoglycan-binding domain-containing protein, partial [Lentisphaerae bacterium]|nr:LysM peptidoglycan-binding domain-containing protein [Lentisphaerota bacterium]
MRTALVVTAVVAAHVAAVAGVMIIQGCGTIVRPSAPPEPPLMPPAPEEMAAPEPVPVKPEPQQWPAETTTYTVRPGDSLSVIATRYGLSVAEIVALNGIRNPDMIREGQKLVLPGSVDVEAPAPAT